MGIDDLLGLGAPGGNVFNIVQGDGSAVPQPSPPQAPQFQRPHGIRNFLGMIGDALLVAHDKAPAYQNWIQQQRQNQALSGFLTNPDQAIQQLMQIDPKSGIALYRDMHPPSEHTMEQKVYEYEKGLPENERPAFERSIQLTHPGMATPIQVESGSIVGGQPVGGSLPTVASQGDYDKLPPGAHYLSTDGHERVKGGAAASTPLPTFR